MLELGEALPHLATGFWAAEARSRGNQLLEEGHLTFRARLPGAQMTSLNTRREEIARYPSHLDVTLAVRRDTGGGARSHDAEILQRGELALGETRHAEELATLDENSRQEARSWGN